jgi:hypothetical protein
MCSICGSSEWSSPGYGVRPAWCDISTTSCCISISRGRSTRSVLAKRLRRFSLTLEPTKTKLVEFGRYVQGKRMNRIEAVFPLDGEPNNDLQAFPRRIVSGAPATLTRDGVGLCRERRGYEGVS